jgi:hypothetical protein
MPVLIGALLILSLGAVVVRLVSVDGGSDRNGSHGADPTRLGGRDVRDGW